ncbi:aldo/keto reductase [Pseudonocardia kujensis]|uniref:aldo/keto reductase n=1 Tax=Pseudonocardia kujensis TaxID=1128675 RepID=UPI001E3E4FB8|nr:aldo/keto reductase [Pseudonocardia kujensis]MCE0762889.1 aldo/keto reductase [Pseudonocardia kujensis]
MTRTETRPSPGGRALLGDRSVARIGFGIMQLAENRSGRPAPGPAEAVALLRHAVAAGVDHVDTAQFYGDGAANALLRRALHPYPEELVLATKVGAVHTPAGLVLAQRPEQLRAAVEENLRALGVERLGIVNLRRADAPPGLVAEGDQRVPPADQLAELVALRDAGAIGGIGLSNVDAEQLAAALPAGIACVQNAYNVLDRTSEPVRELCRRHGVAWVPFFPLGSAFPGVPKVTDHPAVRAAADALGATPAQVGLAWLLAHDPHTLLIPGTTSLAHLEANLAAGDLTLDAEILATLDALT